MAQDSTAASRSGHAHGSPPMTPDLALVDPDLAAALRALLPDSGDCLAPRPRALPVAGPSEVAWKDERRSAPDHRRLRRSVATAGAWLLLGGIVASPLLAFLPPASAPIILDTPESHASPKETVDGSITGLTIRWRDVSGAVLYNVILTRGSKRFDRWTLQPHIRIEESKTRGMPALRYAWFVYPGFKSNVGRLRYGGVVAHGGIKVRGELRSNARPSAETPGP